MITNEEKMLILLKWSPDLHIDDLNEYYEEYVDAESNESFTEYMDWVMSDEYTEMILKEEAEFWEFFDQASELQ